MDEVLWCPFCMTNVPAETTEDHGVEGEGDDAELTDCNVHGAVIR